MYNNAQKKATAKYLKNKCEQISMTLPKEKHYKEIWKAEAEKAGENLTQYIVRQVERGRTNDKKRGKRKKEG